MNLLSNRTFIRKFLPARDYFARLTRMAACSIESINFDQLIEHMKNRVYLVDVREKEELLDTGTLPNSINIPVNEVEAALQLPDDDFTRQYGADKPKPDAEIIFSCRAGRRSEMAAQAAAKLGFEKVLNYSGGWLDWEKNCKEQN